MPNYKHLTLDNRITIESMLNAQSSFREIATALDKEYAWLPHVERLGGNEFLWKW